MHLRQDSFPDICPPCLSNSPPLHLGHSPAHSTFWCWCPLVVPICGSPWPAIRLSLMGVAPPTRPCSPHLDCNRHSQSCPVLCVMSTECPDRHGSCCVSLLPLIMFCIYRDLLHPYRAAPHTPPCLTFITPLHTPVAPPVFFLASEPRPCRTCPASALPQPEVLYTFCSTLPQLAGQSVIYKS